MPDEKFDNNPFEPTPEVLLGINGQVIIVASLRKELNQLKEEKGKAFKKWENDQCVLLRNVALKEDEVFKAELKLRQMAEEECEKTKDKKPGIGLGIRLVKRFIYNPELALAWAKEHSLALNLNTKEFEKQTLISKPDFVTIIEQPQATIAPNLEILLEAQQIKLLGKTQTNLNPEGS